MSILKELCQAVFRQHKGRRVMPGKRIVRRSAQRHTRNTPTRIPVTAALRRSRPIKNITNKQGAKTRPNGVVGQAKTPFKAMINLASIFTNKSTNSIRLTKIPLPNKENGKLRIQATDTESWFSGTIKHNEPDNKNPMGQVCVDASVIKKVTASTNGTTNIKLFKKGIDINDYSVPASCKVSEFPSIPEPTDMKTTRKRTYNITDLGQKLAFLAPALAKADAYSRAQVVICFDVKRGKLVTTDGMRMHITPTGLQGHNAGYTGKDVMVLPKILKVAKVLSGKFQLLQNHRIVFGLDVTDCQAEVGSKLCEGQYLGYHEVIPKENSFCGKYIADKNELLIALKRAIAVTTEDDKGARFEFSAKVVRISVTRSENSSPLFRAVLTRGQYKGNVFIGDLNPRYLLDAIQGMPDNHIEILLPKSRNSAWLIKGPQSKYMAVIMPMNIEEEE